MNKACVFGLSWIIIGFCLVMMKRMFRLLYWCGWYHSWLAVDFLYLLGAGLYSFIFKLKPSFSAQVIVQVFWFPTERHNARTSIISSSIMTTGSALRAQGLLGVPTERLATGDIWIAALKTIRADINHQPRSTECLMKSRSPPWITTKFVYLHLNSQIKYASQLASCPRVKNLLN